MTQYGWTNLTKKEKNVDIENKSKQKLTEHSEDRKITGAHKPEGQML